MYVALICICIVQTFCVLPAMPLGHAWAADKTQQSLVVAAFALGVLAVCCPNVLLRASALPSHHTGQDKRVFEFFCIHE